VKDIGWVGSGTAAWKRGASLLEGIVVRASACLRRAAGGQRAQIVRYGRFIANEKVSVAALLEGWGEQTGRAAAGRRHVLAIQDTSEINFRTTQERRRGLGEIGKGGGRGVLLHAMLAVDADTDTCLGLVAGDVWTRSGRVTLEHGKRPIGDKESRRWVETAQKAREVLAGAATITVIDDREGDIYEKWATVRGPGVDLLTRSMHDRALADKGSMYAAAAAFPVADVATLELIARANRPARKAELTMRFGTVSVNRPQRAAAHLPRSLDLTLIEVVEDKPPPGVEPLHWYLLTSHAVHDAKAAWDIVGLYRKRWIIEQFFRTLKTQGLQLEDSRLETADRLLKITAIAARAAVIIMQLVQARDGHGVEPTGTAFSDKQVDLLAALGARYEGRTRLQSNPHQPRSLAWAAWIIARLGGWDGYPRTKPGPITMRHGLQYFLGVANAWDALQDL
jgi:hypothetical protein